MQRGLQLPGSPNELFQRNRVNLAQYTEAIWNPLYDYQTKTAAATATQRFFIEPIGGASNKTISDTNMTLSSQIPKGQAFDILGIEVDFFPGETIQNVASTVGNEFAEDVYQFYKSGALILTIGSKEYVYQAPLMKFPPSHRLDVDSSVSTTVAATGATFLYASAAGREFATRGLLLESNQNFSVTLSDTAALPSGVAGRVGVTLNGWLYRNAQ